MVSFVGQNMLFEPLFGHEEKIFKNWKLDEQFIRKVMELASKVDYVSFDIFDTALTRQLNSPIDAFAAVEERLLKAYGSSMKGFALAREKAEQLAREAKWRKYRDEEITFEDIYDHLFLSFPNFKNVDFVKKLEKFVEESILLAVPDILELTHKLRDIGKPFFFVSDMYHSSEFLGKILENNGYKGWENIFVSSEIGYTKSSGNIWKSVFQVHQGRILHIGDDLHSDVKTPREYNILTLAYRRVVSDRRVGARLDPHVLPFSKLKRYLDLQDAAHDTSLDQRRSENFWYRFGQVMGGIVLSSFVRWLAERVQVNKIETLYFCARDGYLMQKAWEASGLSERIAIDYRYFYTSRSVLNMSSGLLSSSEKKLDNHFLNFLMAHDGKITIHEILTRSGLINLDNILSKIEVEVGDINKIFKYDDYELICKIIQDNSDVVYPILRKFWSENLDNLFNYLYQEKLFDISKKAMVDMGWQGTLQRSLNYLISCKGIDSKISGFYYGLWNEAKGNDYLSGIMESCFTSRFLPLHDQCEIWQAVALLEQLHSSPDGTTKGYIKCSDGSYAPVFNNNITENEQYNNKTKFFQDGALDIVTKVFNNDENIPIKLSDLTPQSALAAIGSYILSPTPNELEEIKNISHCSTFDHSNYRSILNDYIPDSNESLQNIVNHSDWIIGQMLYWWNKADQDQKRFLQNFIRENLSFFNERVLRQFL